MLDNADESVTQPARVQTNRTQPARVQTAPHPMPSVSGQTKQAHPICFNRMELMTILNIYGRMVAAGEWRDYAIDTLKDRAVFSIYRRTSEMPLYRIEKTPKLARKQGAYSLISPQGQILKRGHDLSPIISLLNRKLMKLVET